MAQGTVKRFDAEEGFGFVGGEDGEDLCIRHTARAVEGYGSFEGG